MIKAIETKYKGYRFRSRLEARWAVFFDALGIKWEYEPEGFDLDEAGYYLPDFRLTEHNQYVEIKPEGDVSPVDLAKLTAFEKLIGRQAFQVLHGIPVSFHDDDRRMRFEAHLEQFIFFTRLHIKFDDMRKASLIARSARFEHGETPC